MMLEKVIEDLIIKNDFNNLSEEELKQKYCKDEESYKIFLETFNRIFTRKHSYPLIILDRHKDIMSLIGEGTKYGGEYERSLENMIAWEVKRDREYDLSDSGQMEDSFLGQIGAKKIKKSGVTYKNAITGILDSVWILSQEGTVSKDDYESYLDTCLNNILSGETPSSDFDDIINNYYKEHPKMHLCHNISFLFAANHLMSAYPSLCDEDFLNLTKEVISISESDFVGIIPEDFDQKKYHKVAEFTTKKIETLEQNNAKKEEPKKKKKGIFQKH